MRAVGTLVVPGATERIKSGDLLAVDGAAGEVRLLPPDAGQRPDR